MFPCAQRFPCRLSACFRLGDIRRWRLVWLVVCHAGAMTGVFWCRVSGSCVRAYIR
jgi:hypothetical protein